MEKCYSELFFILSAESIVTTVSVILLGCPSELNDKFLLLNVLDSLDE